MVNGEQVRSHLRIRVGEREDGASEQGSILKQKRAGGGCIQKNMLYILQIVLGHYKDHRKRKSKRKSYAHTSSVVSRKGRPPPPQGRSMDTEDKIGPHSAYNVFR
eukprot:193155-Pelagomonas_calceolata.AAC.1